MSADRLPCSRAWAWAPLVLWAACTVAAAVWTRDSLVFDLRGRAAAHYDEGTRAAMAGDLGRAVLELRRAQSLHAPWRRDPEALGARIDGNLREARRRVAASMAGTDSAAGAGRAVDARDQTASEGVADAERRALGELALACVRSVPRPTRVALAAAAMGLACALAASRLLARGVGSRSLVPSWLPWFAAGAAASLVCAAGVDRLVDARRAEAVLVRASLPRQGPDDLTYAPAALTPLPAGAEVRVDATTADGLWVRVRPSDSGAAGRGVLSGASGGLGWVPASAVEPVFPRRDR